MRTVLLVLVVLVLGTLWADDPPTPDKTKPPYERLLTGEDEKTAATLKKRIADLESDDKCAEAGKAAEELAALRTRVQGADHWQTRDARLKVSTLERLETLPAAERKKVREAEEANGQGLVHYSKGKYAEAQPLFEKSLDLYRKVLGDEHHFTAAGCTCLADNLRAQGKYAAAMPLYEKSLAICRKTLGEDHPYTAAGCKNLGYNLQAQGKYAEAQPLYEKALTIDRKVLGEEHPDTASSYNALAINLYARGKYAEAQPLYEKALAITRRALGEEHRDIAAICTNLALNLKDQGKYAEAQPLFEKALAIWC